MAIDVRPHSKRSNFFSKKAYILFGLCGLIFILIGFYLTYAQTILSFNFVPIPIQPEATRRAPPSRILIDSTKIDLTIQPGEIINGIWQIAPQTASHLAQSARPGENGNMVIYGHNKNKIFRPLHKVKIGDRIQVMSVFDEAFTYEVKEVITVSPQEIELVLPTDFEVLTVYTCTGFLDSQRLVVRAIPL